MFRPNQRLRREALCGLVLLSTLPALADAPLRQVVREQLRQENYVLVEDVDGARLFVLLPGELAVNTTPRQVDDSRRSLYEALAKTRSTDSRTRVRGLTLLSGVDDPVAVDAALVLLSDPVAAVREEAVHLLLEHPDADLDSIAAIASRDPSPRVREACAEFISKHSDDQGD